MLIYVLRVDGRPVGYTTKREPLRQLMDSVIEEGMATTSRKVCGEELEFNEGVDNTGLPWVELSTENDQVWNCDWDVLPELT